MSKMSEYHARLRREIDEEACLERMRQVRAKRQLVAGPFRLDYVDQQGRSGSQIAAAAGRLGEEPDQVSKLSRRTVDARNSKWWSEGRCNQQATLRP